MHIVLTYRSTCGALSLRVPALDGLTAQQVAEAAYVVTHLPPTNYYGTPGAAEIAQAYFARPSAGQCLAPLGIGDTVHAAGAVLELVDQTGGTPDAWGVQTPVFAVAEAPGAGLLHVSATCPPPDHIAYAEDNRDRLWTGKGAGIWRCLTDVTGRAVGVSWRTVWQDHGPLKPLMPVTVSQTPPPPIGRTAPAPESPPPPPPRPRPILDPPVAVRGRA